MLYWNVEDATFDGLRSLVSSLKTTDVQPPPVTSGGLFTSPARSTPGMASIASTMRFSMAVTLSPRYPALFKSTPSSIAFRGSKPKWLLSERASPRTATIDEVTSTAQIRSEEYTSDIQPRHNIVC